MGIIQCKYRPSDAEEANFSNEGNHPVTNDLRQSKKVERISVRVI